EGSIDDASMRRMNAAAELAGKDFASIAATSLGARAGAAAQPVTPPKAASGGGFWQRLTAPDFGRLTVEHLALAFLSLAASIPLGIPLGIVAAKVPAAAGPIVGATGVVQTIPALALLAFLI